MEPINFNLSIGVIKISSVCNASAVNIGKNLLLDWDSHSKSNQGLGNISGDNNLLEHLANQVHDPDKIDQFSQASQSALSQPSLDRLVEKFLQEEAEDESIY